MANNTEAPQTFGDLADSLLQRHELRQQILEAIIQQENADIHFAHTALGQPAIEVARQGDSIPLDASHELTKYVIDVAGGKEQRPFSEVAPEHADVPLAPLLSQHEGLLAGLKPLEPGETVTFITNGRNSPGEAHPQTATVIEAEIVNDRFEILRQEYPSVAALFDDGHKWISDPKTGNKYLGRKHVVKLLKRTEETKSSDREVFKTEVSHQFKEWRDTEPAAYDENKPSLYGFGNEILFTRDEMIAFLWYIHTVPEQKPYYSYRLKKEEVKKNP